MKRNFKFSIPFFGIVCGLLLTLSSGELPAGENVVHFEGTRSNHEGFAFWNSDGNGNERAALGHAIPFQMGSQPYFMATADFDNIDPSAIGGMSAKAIGSEFSNFDHMINVMGFHQNDLTLKWDAYSLGNDTNGKDWWIKGTIETRIYRSEGYLTIQIAGEDLVGTEAPDLYVYFDWGSRQYVILSPAFTLENKSGSSSHEVQELAAILMRQLNGRRVLIQKPLQPLPNSVRIPSGNGRSGGVYPTGDVYLELRDDGLAKSPELFQPIESDVPEKLEIYPNPFNPVATIQFSMEKSGFVSLGVYDILGREVTTVVEESLPAGVHRYEWNATDKASGIYIFKLEISGKTITGRAHLLK